MLEYAVAATRTEAAVAVARAGRAAEARLALDIDPAGRQDAFNPAELLLAAVAACMLKGIERITPMLDFRLRAAGVSVHGVRQDSPPRMLRIEYELVIDTDETDRRLALLHDDVRKFGTIVNTVAAAVELTGRVRRGAVPESSPPERHATRA